MVQYRVYDRLSLDYVDGGIIKDYVVDMDYISDNASSVTLVEETFAQKGDIIVALEKTRKLFIGCITAVDNTKKKISFKHMKELFNDTVLNIFKYSNILGYKFDAVEAIYEILNLAFVKTDDDKKKLPLILEKVSSASGAVWTDDSASINILDFLATMFDKFNVYLDIDINFLKNKLVCKIIKNASKGMVIKDNIKMSEPTFDSNELPTYNKAVVYEEESGKILGTYYLCGDNTITDNAQAENRLLPVKTKYLKFDDSKDITELELATSELQGNQCSHCIQYKLSKEQTLVKALNFNYGDAVKIIYEGREYDSVFTGIKYNKSDPYYTCYFGKARIDFTDRLKQYIDKRYRKV